MKKGKMYNYFNNITCKWEKVDAEWLNGVKLKGLKEVYREDSKYIKCVYESGEELYYEDVHGTWGFPVKFV